MTLTKSPSDSPYFFLVLLLLSLWFAVDAFACPIGAPDGVIPWSGRTYRIQPDKDQNGQVMECPSSSKGACKALTCGFPRSLEDSEPFQVRALAVHKNNLMAGTSDGLFQWDPSKQCWKKSGPKKRREGDQVLNVPVTDIATLTSFGEDLYAGRDGGADVCGLWLWAPAKDRWERVLEEGCWQYFSQVRLGETIYLAGSYSVHSYAPARRLWCDLNSPPDFQIYHLRLEASTLLACGPSSSDSTCECYSLKASSETGNCPRSISWTPVNLVK